MASKLKSWLRENGKDLLIVVTLTFVVFYVAVFASVWADRNYKSDFWPDFFKWSGIVSGVGLVVAWIIFWTRTGRNS